MSAIEDLADALARDTIAAGDEIGDDRLHEDIARAVSVLSPTMQEAFMTAIRIRLAERRGLSLLENRIAAFRRDAPAPDRAAGSRDPAAPQPDTQQPDAPHTDTPQPDPSASAASQDAPPTAGAGSHSPPDSTATAETHDTARAPAATAEPGRPRRAFRLRRGEGDTPRPTMQPAPDHPAGG